MLTLFFKLLLRLTSVMSLSMAHRLGAFLGWLFVVIPNQQKKIAEKNINLCLPELDPQKQKELLHDCLIETGKTLTEMGIMWLGDSSRVLKLIKSVDGEEHLKNALSKNKGVLLALPHIGSWELINLYASAHYPVTALYKPPHLEALGSIIKSARQRTGATLVPTDTTGVRAVSKALKNGEIVIILPDQQPYVHKHNGIFSPLFGHAAYSMTLMSKLAEKSDSEIVYAYARRLPGGAGFTLVFRPATSNTNKSDLQHSVDIMNHDIERVVRDCPEQYQWTYKRFKNRPDGESAFY